MLVSGIAQSGQNLALSRLAKIAATVKAEVHLDFSKPKILTYLYRLFAIFFLQNNGHDVTSAIGLLAVGKCNKLQTSMSCADPEGGQGVRTPLKITKNIGFPRQYWSGSPKIRKSTKPVFNVGRRWPAYSGIWILPSPSSTKKKNTLKLDRLCQNFLGPRMHVLTGQF